MSEQTFVMWADPGLLTGLAWYDVILDAFGSGQYGPSDLRRKLDQFPEACKNRMILGYERFNVTSGGAKTSTPEHSHRAIQILDGYAKENLISLAKPQPSSARNLGQVVYLRRIGWYKPGKGHANDAAQHLLADLLKRKPMPLAIRQKLFPGYAPRGNLSP